MTQNLQAISAVRTSVRAIQCALAVALCAAFLLPGHALAQEQDSGDEETIRYTIQRGDTCYGIAQRYFGNPRQCHEVIYRYNPQMGRDPHNIRPGVTITIPVRRPRQSNDEGPDARVTRRRQSVQARASASAQWGPAQRGQSLFRGWRVNTESGASAELTFRDSSRVQMRENTLVIIYGGESSRTSRRATGQATLERGTLRSRLGELRMQVDTPDASAALNGGSSVISVDEEGTARVSNHSGGGARVRSGSGGAPVTVQPGFGSEVARGQRPSRPRRLPAAPSLEEGTPTVVVGIAEQGATLRASWSEVPNARSYRVEISTEEDGTGLIAAVQAPANVRSVEVHRLPAGTYYIGLATIDRRRFESRPAARRGVRAAIVGLQAPGSDEPQTDVETGDWTTTPEAPTTLRGTRIVSPEGLTCTTEAGETVLEAAGPATIRCVDEAGEALPEVSASVVAPEVRVVSESGATLSRGESTEWRIAIDSEQPLPEAYHVVAPEGFTAGETRVEDGALVVSLTAAEDAPEAATLSLRAGPAGTEDAPELATVDVTVPPAAAPAPAALPVVRPLVPPPSRPVSEAFALARHPGVLALQDDRRVGSGGFIGVSHNGQAGLNTGYWRVLLGVEAAPLEALRIGIAHTIDVYERGSVPAQRGDRDLSAWVGYRVLRDLDYSVYVELGAWFPTGGDREGISDVRLSPSVTASYRHNDNLRVRTRQGAILALDRDGPFLWGSAYGADLRMGGTVHMGLELDLSLGSVDNDFYAGVGIGPTLSGSVGPASLSIGMRYGATDDFRRTVGRFTISGGLRLSFD